MVNFKVLLKKNLIEMARSSKFIVFPLVFCVIAVISAFSAKYMPVILDYLLTGIDGGSLTSILNIEASVAESYVQLISNFGEMIILLVGVVFVSSIVKEKTKGTYSSLKMNGVKDTEIVLSHFVAQVILVSVSYISSVMVFVLLNIVLFNQIMGLRGVVVLTYLFLLLLVTICFSLFISCVTNTRGSACVIVILSYFVFSLLELLPRINRVNPFHLLSISTNLMYVEAYSFNEHLVTFLSSIGICVVFMVLALLLVKSRINNRRGVSK